jgi:hypothetical protein
VVRESVTFRKVKNIDKTLLEKDLRQAAEELLNSETDDINWLVSTYDNRFRSILDKHAPQITKLITHRKKVPWFDSEALDLKRTKRRLERKWRCSKTETDKNRYQEVCTRYKDHLTQSKDVHYNNLIAKCGNDSKKLFNIINELTGNRKQKIIPDNTSTDTLSEEFANFFLEKIQHIRDELDLYPEYQPPISTTATFDHFLQTSEQTVRRLLISAKPASCDLDPIPTYIVKDFVDIFAPILTKIVNLSLATSSFADSWKDAIIIPLLKKASLDKNILSHYRPISNLSFISKITEKSALHQLCPYIEDNDLLPPYQSAYRKYYSTETAVTKLINDILWNMENQLVTSIISMEISAAFDTVDHNILLNVLRNCFGIKNQALKWVDNYLRPRSLHVKISDTSSTSRPLPFSVPQGSAAGPILYTAYASTLQYTIKDFNNSISGYADDHMIYDSFSSAIPQSESSCLDHQEQCLNSIRDWMSSNRLKMNDSKTEFILCGHKAQLKKCQRDLITVGSIPIQVSKSIKYLGILLDAELNFKSHIINKCKIASLNLRNIRAIRKHLSVESCKTLVQALVISHLDYGNAILTDLPESTLKPAQRIQNHAAKIILGRQKYDSTTSALHDLHWLPIRLRCRFKLLLLVFKCLHQQAPSYLCDLLVLQNTSSRPTRSSASSGTRLIVPRTARSTFASRSFSVAGPYYWNKLPTDLRICNNTDTFRKKLKTHLFNEYFIQQNHG